MVQISDSHNNVALDVDKGEFHCPFCKAVGNLMVRVFVEFRMIFFFCTIVFSSVPVFFAACFFSYVVSLSFSVFAQRSFCQGGGVAACVFVCSLSIVTASTAVSKCCGGDRCERLPVTATYRAVYVISPEVCILIPTASWVPPSLSFAATPRP